MSHRMKLVLIAVFSSGFICAYVEAAIFGFMLSQISELVDFAFKPKLLGHGMVSHFLCKVNAVRSCRVLGVKDYSTTAHSLF